MAGNKEDHRTSRIPKDFFLALMEAESSMDIYIRFLTFAIFALAGFDLSKSVPRPRHIYSWVLLIMGTTLAGFVGIHVALVSIFGYGVYLNMVLLGLCCGFVVGFILRLVPRFKIR